MWGVRSGGIDVKSVQWKGDFLFTFLPSSKDFAGLYPELLLPSLQTEVLGVCWPAVQFGYPNAPGMVKWDIISW